MKLEKFRFTFMYLKSWLLSLTGNDSNQDLNVNLKFKHDLNYTCDQKLEGIKIRSKCN